MSIAAEMKTLTADIIASYNARVKAIGTIVKDTSDLLKAFNTDRSKMAAEQAKSLADFVADLAKNVDNMLKGFATDHKKMSAKQAEDLAYFMKDLTKNVGNMIKNFQKEHKENAAALKENVAALNASLEKGEADRLKDFNAMMGNIQKEVKEIENYIAKKLKEFSDSHADMSKELMRDLAKYVSGIVNETKKLLSGYADEREKMDANWKSLVATMAKKRGVKPEVEAQVKVRHVKGAIEEEEKEVSSEMDLEKLEKLEKKVLKFIEKHTGVKVGDMEEPLGVNRTTLGQIAKKLLYEGKVRKEENLYFPL